MTNTFTVGTCIVNLGCFAVVKEVRPDGLLVVENPRIGKWIADPAKCTRYYLQFGDAD